MSGLARLRLAVHDEVPADAAPAFYAALGYAVALAIEGYAPGVVKYTLVKRSDGA